MSSTGSYLGMFRKPNRLVVHSICYQVLVPLFLNDFEGVVANLCHNYVTGFEFYDLSYHWEHGWPKYKFIGQLAMAAEVPRAHCRPKYYPKSIIKRCIL